MNLVSFVGVAVILCYPERAPDPARADRRPAARRRRPCGTRCSRRRAYDRQRDRIAAVNADLQENISGVRVTQAFRREDRNTSNFLGLTARLPRRRAALAKAAVDLLLLRRVPRQHRRSCSCSASAARSLRPAATRSAIGALTAFLLYLTQLFAPVQQLSQVFDTYQQATAGHPQASRACSTRRSPLRSPSRSRPAGRSRAIGFEGVRFRYPGTTTEALARRRPHDRAGRDGRPRRRDRRRQVDRREAGRPLLRPDRRARCSSTALDLTETSTSAPTGASSATCPRSRSCSRAPSATTSPTAAPDATDAEVEAAARAVGAHDFIVAVRRLPEARCPSGAGRCRSASASCSAWPGPSSSTRRSSCSTRRPRTSTWPPRRGSTGPWGWWPAAAPRSSSPTGSRPPGGPTGSSCIDERPGGRGGQPRRARSRRAGATPRCGGPSTSGRPRVA